MGRWFGFRKGYEDLTRIYMTSDLSGWFSDLALVEHDLRQDIKMYEAYNLTPSELGTRILKHPAMLVTSKLKQRYARTIIVEQSYSNQVLQTIRFPFQKPEALGDLLNSNISATREFISSLDRPIIENQFLFWQDLSPDQIISYLRNYRVDTSVRNISIPLIIDYIQHLNEFNELINWTVAIRGRESVDPILGKFNFSSNVNIPMISRTRLAGDPDSLGVITNPGDEKIGLTPEQLQRLNESQQSEVRTIGINPAARLERSPHNGLLIIYPVSKYSGHERIPNLSRRPLFEEPRDPNCSDVVCLAISFPKTDRDQGIRGEYVVGSVRTGGHYDKYRRRQLG